MNTTLMIRIRLWTGGLALLLAAAASAADVVPTVITKTEAFANATLVSQTESHVFLKHSRGVASLRIADIENEFLVALGVRGYTAPSETLAAPAGADAGAWPGTILAALSAPAIEWGAALTGGGPVPLPFQRALVIAGAVVLALWLFFCWCAKLVCDKAGSPAGFFIWLPGLQMLPLLRAAGMSGWWLPGFLVPVVNLAALVLWSLNIAKVRGKGLATGILLILPVTNLFAFLYLAFSNTPGKPEEPPSRLVFHMEPLPSS